MAEPEELELRFRCILLKIAREIKEIDLESLKFLCKPVITEDRISDIKTTIELFSELENRKKLGCRTVEFLTKLLNAIGRKDLAFLLDKYVAESTVETNDRKEKKKDLDLITKEENAVDQDYCQGYEKAAETMFQQDKFKEAEHLYSKALLTVPEYCTEKKRNFRLNRGACRLKQAKIKEALADFNFVLAIQPKSTKAMLHRSKCLLLSQVIDTRDHILKVKREEPKAREIQLQRGKRTLEETTSTSTPMVSFPSLSTAELLKEKDSSTESIHSPTLSDAIPIQRPATLISADRESQKLEDLVSFAEKTSTSDKEQLKKANTVPGNQPLLPRRILLLCHKWQAWGESIPVVNREMCRALAHGGHQVACLVLDASSVDKEEATRENIRLIKCTEKPGIDKNDVQLLYHHSEFPFNPDLVIGHGKVTGPIASHYADKFSCPRLHILHDLPEECERFDDVNTGTSQACNEMELALSADFVAGIGVLLKDKWGGILNKDVIEIVPGLPDLVTRNTIPSPQCRCFAAAKFSSPIASGLDVAVWALNNSSRVKRPYKATLIARNTDPNSPHRCGMEILSKYDKEGVDLNVKQSVDSRDAFVDIQGSTVFVAPTRIEAFGVASLDAIATEIPVLISAKSGLATTIKQHFDVKFHSCIIDVGDTSDFEDDVDRWSKEIDRILSDRQKAFKFASSLRFEWKDKHTWDSAMETVMGKLVESGNLPSAPATSLAASIIPASVSKSDLELVNEIGLFDKRQKFVLFLSPEDTREEMHFVVSLGLIHWVAVFDFDSASDEKGYLAVCDGFLQNMGKPACRMLPKEGKQRTIPNGIPWILLEGTKAMPRDVSSYLDWISDLFKLIKKKHVHPITFVIIWKSARSTKKLCKKLYNILTVARSSPEWKNAVTVYILSTSTEIDSRLDDIAEEWNATIKVVDMSGLCGAIFNTAVSNPFHQEDPDFSLPRADGHLETLPPWLRWVDSELTVLYSSIGITPEFGKEDASHFYRGGRISWYAIEMNYAVERESWEHLKEKIEARVKYPGASRLLLSHQRGAGGTTSARKILYDFHLRYPCVCLKSITTGTQEAITELWKFCSRPVIILADIKHVPGEEHDLEVLFDSLSNEGVSCLILQMIHRYSLSLERQEKARDKDIESTKKVRTHPVAETLTEKEANDFVEVYSSQNKSRTAKLGMHRQLADKQLQIPFYYGLVAFEDRFEALKPFVSGCLVDLNNTQQLVLVFLAMAHYYAQRALPARDFARILGVPKFSFCSLEDFLPTVTLDLLLEEEGCWQPRHNLISREILCQLLSKPYKIHEANWTTLLAKNAIQFIEHMDERVSSALLTNRVEDDSQRYFSSLVIEIPEEEDAILLFQKAIEVYPENPYFKVHLGRFFSIQRRLQGFKEAIKYTNDGILCAADYSHRARGQFAQMKGMVYKRQVRYLTSDINSEIEDIIPFAEKGVKAFEHAVSICPELSEDAYIPQVRMMCDLFKYVDKKTPGGFFAYLDSTLASQFIINGVSDTSDTLESVPDSDHYPSLRKQLFHVGYRRETVEILTFFKMMKASGKSSIASINRQIVRVQLDLCKEKKIPVSEFAKEMIELLDEALRYYNRVDLTMRLWVKVAPYVPIELSVAENKVVMWCSKERSVWSYLYKYVIVCVRILEGGKDRYEEVRKNAQEDLISAVKGMRRFDVGRIRHADRPVLFLGSGKGMAQLVSLGGSFHDVRKQRAIPLNDKNDLRKLHGVIIRTGKVGEIMANDLRVSFRPDLCDPPLVGDSYMHKRVHFYLAFTCFGADAYNVKVVVEN